MRPVPIPDEAIWAGARRIVVAPPDGDLTNPVIAPVEALADLALDDTPCLSVRCVPEAGDIEALQAGGFVWLTFYGGLMPPFALTVLRDYSPYTGDANG